MDLLERWFTKWRIKVNPNKCTAVYFGSKRVHPPPIKIYNKPILFDTKSKYLGIIFDKRMSWKEHINYVKSKYLNALNKISFIINSPSLDYQNKTLLYKSVLRPILTYAASVWGFTFNTHMEKLQILQNKTLRRASKFPWYIRNDIIHKNLNVESLRQFIVKLAEKFYGNIYSIPNELIYNLPEYDNHVENRRPRSTLNITTALTYRNNDLRPP